MDDLHFRDVRLNEAARLSEFMRAMFLAAYRHCSSAANVDRFLAEVYGEAQQRAELEDAQVETLVAEERGEWLGFAQIRFGKAVPDGVDLPRGAELGRIYLAPAAQGRGIGSRLLREIERRTRARGRDGLWLNVWQEAPQALAFYTREGFAITGTTHFIVGDDAKLDWRMAKRLG